MSREIPGLLPRLWWCTEVFHASVQPVDHHFRQRVRCCQDIGVIDGVAQCQVLVEHHAAMTTRPRAVLIFNDAEVPNHPPNLRREPRARVGPQGPKPEVFSHPLWSCSRPVADNVRRHEEQLRRLNKQTQHLNGFP